MIADIIFGCFLMVVAVIVVVMGIRDSELDENGWG
jgi:hypothetical protein